MAINDNICISLDYWNRLVLCPTPSLPLFDGLRVHQILQNYIIPYFSSIGNISYELKAEFIGAKIAAPSPADILTLLSQNKAEKDPKKNDSIY